MLFEWDDEKNHRNLLKHDLSFETAALVFEDPFALTQRDQLSEDEERWITVGAAQHGAVLFVVHTRVVRDGEEITRIISARKTTPRERHSYEEAHQTTKNRDRRHRRQTKRRY
jgi:uncharacterized protein